MASSTLLAKRGLASWEPKTDTPATVKHIVVGFAGEAGFGPPVDTGERSFSDKLAAWHNAARDVMREQHEAEKQQREAAAKQADVVAADPAPAPDIQPDIQVDVIECEPIKAEPVVAVPTTVDEINFIVDKIGMPGVQRRPKAASRCAAKQSPTIDPAR
jgi:hypothetical protein